MSKTIIVVVGAAAFVQTFAPDEGKGKAARDLCVAVVRRNLHLADPEVVFVEDAASAAPHLNDTGRTRAALCFFDDAVKHVVAVVDSAPVYLAVKSKHGPALHVAHTPPAPAPPEETAPMAEPPALAKPPKKRR